ncbi:helix-turn-helix domain-containing protein [Thermogutta sp.]|uniref:helix-turn-helix domain-containing protein n=1 Tax=Thermogutta sp. TaxID=1962930 RepID=UPI003C79DAA0
MMSEKRSRSQIARLLNLLREPVYFVDGQWRIRFCNRACLEWLACREEDIVDRRCAFHSSFDLEAGDALAAGLCPPPGAFEREQTLGTVACLTPDGQLRRRQARFLRVHDGEGRPALLVVVADRDGTDTAPQVTDVAPDAARQQSQALALHEQIREFRQAVATRFHAHLLVGTSAVAKRMRQQVEAAASLTSHVVIVEPPGGHGTELAKAIFYAACPDPQQCLVPLPCEELDPDILRNTLQAFAAIPLPPGLTHTFILEDLHQLPWPTQQVLYEFLRRAQGIRVIATTQFELMTLVSQGKLIEDLGQMLSTFLIFVPPIRERREDIPLIAQTMLEDCNAKQSKQVMGFTSEVLDILVQHDWPNNYAELASVVQHAHNRAGGTLVDPADLPQDFRWAFQRRLRSLKEPEKISLPAFLAQVEKELLARALRRARGNKSLAAKMLGVSRPRLYRRLVQYGLIPPDEE